MTNPGYINLSEQDYDVLADFEEEQSRRGNFELVFPTPSSIDEYRSYLQQNRRSNLILWSYIKQGSPS